MPDSWYRDTVDRYGLGHPPLPRPERHPMRTIITAALAAVLALAGRALAREFTERGRP